MAEVQEFVDSLSNIVSVAGSVEEAMKKLAAAMLEGVTAVSKTAGTSVVDKIGELIQKDDEREKRVKDFLDKDFPNKLYKEFEKDVKGLVDEVKDCKSSLATIAGKGKPGGGGKCDCEAALQAIKASVDAVNATMGAGVKLDNSVNSILNSIYRRLGGIGQALRSATVRGGGGGGGGGGRMAPPPLPPSGSTPMPGGGIPLPEDREAYEYINESLGDAATNAENLGEALGDGGRYARNLRWNIGELEAAVGALIAAEEKAGTEVGVMEKAYKRLDWWLDAASSHQNLSAKHKRILNDQVRELHAMVQAVRAGTASMDQLEAKQQEVLATSKNIHRRYEAWNTAIGAVNMAGGLMIGNFQKYSNKVLGGMLTDLNEWEKESTRMAATMTGSTHEAGGEAKKLVGQYRDLLKVSNDIVRSTHQFPAVIRKQWLTQIKKGTRNLRETKEVVNNAAAGAWQVGANADAAVDEFQKWNMYIGMSATGSASLARTMSVVSKTTGVMGDNLLAAVSAAREIAQLMRDTGIYSQDIANSVVGWMASATKFGIDKQVQNIFRASQGGLEAFTQASSETRNLLASSGQLQNVLKGDADPDKVMSGVGDAIRNAIPANAFQKDAQGKPIGLPDLKKLSKAEISRLDIVMKRRFGMKLGEATRLLESIQDQNPEQGLAAIERELKNPMLTDAEKQQLEMQKKQLEIARDEKNLSKVMDSFGQMSDAAKQQGKTFNDILRAGRMTETTFRQGISDSSKLLAAKLERQGKTFEEAMGMSRDSFETQMKDLIPRMKAGDVEAMKEFRTLQGKMQDANKMADSSAKNNSNTMDKQETQQQVIQNTLQNLAKPIHTMAAQAPLWLYNLVSIAGGVWALYRLWAQGRISENVKGTFDTLVRTIGTKGSGWVHDPYVEHVVMNIDRNLVGLGKHLTKGKFGGKTATPLKDSTDTKIKSFGDALDVAKSKLQGWWESFTGMLPAGIKDKLDAAKDKVTGAVSDKLGAAKEKMGWKQVNNDQKLLNKGVSPSSGTPANKVGKIAKAKSAPAMKPPQMSGTIKGDPGMMQGAGKLAAIAAGVIALGVVLVAAAKAIMTMTGFDAKQAKEVAWVLGVVIGAGAGALLAAAAAAKVMEWANKTIQPGAIKDIYMGGLMLLAILPAVLILGAVLVGLGALLSLIMDPKKAQEYAWAIGNILLAAGLVATAVLISAAALTVLGALATVAMYILPFMLLGAGALLVLTPAMILLAAAVIKIAEWAQKRLIDPKKAAEVSKNIADIMMAGGLIAAAVLLSAASLTILGSMSIGLLVMIPFMLLGARNLLLLTPAMIALASAVIYMTQKALKIAPEPEKAAKVAKAVADIMVAAGKIALAVMGATVALSALGAMSLTILVMIPLMLLGARSLLLLTPAMILMAKAVIGIASKMANIQDVEKGQAAADNTVKLLESAGAIAKAVIKSQVYLAVFGAMLLVAPLLTPLMFLGGAALLALTPGIMRMALAIIDISNKMANTTDVAAGVEAAKNLSSLLESTLSIANSVSKAKSYLAVFGVMSTVSFILNPLMKRGADSLTKLTSGIMAMLSAVIGIANRLGDSKTINEAASSVQGVVRLLDALPGFIEGVSSKMDKLARSKRLNTDLNKQTREFATWFYGIGYSLAVGIIEPIRYGFPPQKDLVDMQNSVKQMAGLLDSLAVFMEHLARTMLSFSESWWWSSLPQIDRSSRVFSYYFWGIGWALKHGIIDPIMKGALPQTSEIDQATSTLSVVTNSLVGLAEVMSELSEVLAEIGSINLDFSQLEEVGGVFKSGKLELKIVAQNEGGIDEYNNDTWMKKMMGIFSGVRGGAGILRGRSGFSSMGENRGTGRIASNVNKTISTHDLFVESVAMDISENLSSVSENIQKMSDVFLQMPIEADINAVADEASPVISRGDFDAQVQARVEQSRPSAEMQAATDYLAEIAVNTSSTVEELVKVNENLEEIKEQLKPKGGGEAPQSRANRPRGTPNYYSWQFGRFSDTSAKQHVNSGV
jgi:hypothetical protein